MKQNTTKLGVYWPRYGFQKQGLVFEIRFITSQCTFHTWPSVCVLYPVRSPPFIPSLRFIPGPQSGSAVRNPRFILFDDLRVDFFQKNTSLITILNRALT